MGNCVTELAVLFSFVFWLKFWCITNLQSEIIPIKGSRCDSFFLIAFRFKPGVRSKAYKGQIWCTRLWHFTQAGSEEPEKVTISQATHEKTYYLGATCCPSLPVLPLLYCFWFLFVLFFYLCFCFCKFTPSIEVKICKKNQKCIKRLWNIIKMWNGKKKRIFLKKN